MFKNIDPAEMNAAKEEMRQAMARRYMHDGRDKAEIFGAMSTVLAELLAEMIATAAKDQAHRERLTEMLGILVQSHADKTAAHLGK